MKKIYPYNPHSKFISHTLIFFALLVSLLGSVVFATPAYAAGITVNSDADTTADDGACTLREAIANANGDSQLYVTVGECAAGSGTDSITFDSVLSGGIIYLASTLTLSSNLTIDGSGLASQVTISGDSDNNGTGDVRVFDIDSGVTAMLDNLTITKGSATTAGAIYNNSGSTLTVINSTISDNTATAGPGGGIRNDGTLTVTNSTFSGNIAANSGGGIRNIGALTVTNSTFSGNTSTSASGGGIYNVAGFTSVTITNSTFSGNQAASQGGGIYFSGGTLNYANTIIANSTTNSIPGGDCDGSGTIGTNINNLVENGGCSASLSGDPALDSLSNNGGPTQTFALIAGSSAINAGDDATCAGAPNNLDQRGTTRPQGNHCDIGAVETVLQSGPSFIVNTNDNGDDGACDEFNAGLTDCSLREAINASNFVSGDNSITFAGDYTITLGPSLPDVLENLLIDGTGHTVTISGNYLYHVFHVNGVTLDLDTLNITNGYSLDGGGLYNSGGTVNITNSTFSNNSTDSAGWGGAIYNYGTMTIKNSTFIGNAAGVLGGAIYNCNNSNLAISNSTFSNNNASEGGAIYNYETATLTTVNSTFSGNNGSAGAGGISNTGTLNYANTIFANSTGFDCETYGAFGTIGTNTHNLVESSSSCGTPASTADPNLGPLANNGGLTQTHALLAGSPAINAGDDTTCTASPVNDLDQRGFTRALNGQYCDIGAYEYQDSIAPIVISSTRAEASPTASASVDFTVNFSEPVTGVDSGDFNLSLSGVTGASVTDINGGPTAYTVTVNTGSGSGTIRLDVIDNDTILDSASNPLNGGFTNGEIYTVNKTLTFNSSSAQDGWILESSETSGNGGTMNSAATVLYIGDNTQKKQYRSVLSFNTSSLPDNAVITKVTLKLKRQGITGSGNPVSMFQGFMVDIKKGFFGTAPLALADFKATANKTVGPQSPALTAGWYSLNLTPAKAYINKLATNSGLSQIRLRFKLDDNNNATANFLKLYSGNAGAANRPQLIIEYYIP